MGFSQTDFGSLVQFLCLRLMRMTLFLMPTLMIWIL
uniref:Uncharacterized protein n=1 Tax=Vitis vinifera TaxID=29760 RepID=F6HIU5_VITVI